MLDTTSVLALAGVLLAALVAAGLNVSQARRDAWLKAWVGIRLLLTELTDALTVAELGTDDSATVEVLSLLPLTTSEWEARREAIAPFVGQAIWLDIDRAYADIGAMNWLAPSETRHDSANSPENGAPPTKLAPEQHEIFVKAQKDIAKAKDGLENIKGRKPSVRRGPWTVATGVFWLIALLLAALGIGVISVDVYHARPWKSEPVVVSADDVAWSLEQRFSGDIAACEPVDSVHREFRCTITTPTPNATYAFSAKSGQCQLASAFKTRARHTSGLAAGCNGDALARTAPGSKLLLHWMKTRSEITHPRDAPDEPVTVAPLLEAQTSHLLNPSPSAA